MAWDRDPTLVNPLSAAPRGLLLDPHYRAGVVQLGSLGLSYDAWLFFPQLPEVSIWLRRIRIFQSSSITAAGIVRISSYRDRRKEVFETWARSMRQLARLHNVYVKLGGLGMRINGFDFEKGERPPSSLELAETWKPRMHTCIEAFGVNRRMFESNFPVDKGSYPYSNGWNAFKRLTRQASAEERAALFRGTATTVYRLSSPV
ncbi:amidohydrolase family protein [Paraburkholderia sp. Cy-641]|uniref:amidohydrolase family protein n=1 Tax=Burkholderiaceae TaxID=119060 RepID=UPI0031F593FC